MKCKNCNKYEAVKYSKYSTGEFCSRECARAYSTKEKRKDINKRVSEKLKGREASPTALENLKKGSAKGYPTPDSTKQKISESLKKRCYGKIEDLYKTCGTCNKLFFAGNKGNKKSEKRKFCSIKCATLNINSEEMRQKQSNIMMDRASKGLIKNKAIKCKYLFSDKIILCDSKVEYACLDFFEKKYNVIDIERSHVIIKYEYGEVIRKYNPDFLITTTIGSFIIECKTIIKNNYLNNKWRKYNEVSKIKKEKLEEYAKKEKINSFWFTKQLHRSFYDSLKNRKDILA